jgi:hypothetical protein
MKSKAAQIAVVAIATLAAGCTSARAEVFGRNADRGAIAGGVLGAIIGNNSGNRDSVKGAAIGAGAGLVLGAIMDQNEYRSRNRYPSSDERRYPDVFFECCNKPVVYRYEHLPRGGTVIVERRYRVNGRLYVEYERPCSSHSGRPHRRY